MKNKKAIIMIGITVLILILIIIMFFINNKKVEPETNYCTVRFNTLGGTKVEKIEVEKGEKLKLPKAPTKEGYQFEYWQDENGKEVKENIIIEKDTELTASWKKEKKEEKTITITFDSQGGNEIKSLRLKPGDKIQRFPHPTKKGYRFIVWKDKNEIPFHDGIEITFEEDFTLYAYWEKEQESIKPTPTKKTYYCEDGYELINENKCQKLEEKPMEVAIFCDHGLKNDNGKCVGEVRTSNFKCPTNNPTEINGNCYQEVTGPYGSPISDESNCQGFGGTLFKNGRCYGKSVPKEPICPSGTKSYKPIDGSSYNCIIEKKPKLKKSICPIGYIKKDNKTCVKRIIIDAKLK